MTLTTRERKALNAADDSDGVSRSDGRFYRIGDPTIDGLVGRGLIEKFPQPVAGYPLYRTTEAGKAALRAPEVPKPAPTRPKVKMLEPAIKPADFRTVKPTTR